MSIKPDDDNRLVLLLPKAESHSSLPLDVRKAIEREAQVDPSDPFLARRLAAHYKQGIWIPADGRAKS